MNTTFSSIIKIAFIHIILLTGCFYTSAVADTEVTVAILPFSLEAKELTVIKTRIPKILSEMLEQEGARVVLKEVPLDTEQWNFSRFKKLGIEWGVDYILKGAIFVVGESISIDSKLINVHEENNETSFFSDAKDGETLFSSISQLSKNIIGEVYQKEIITNIAVSGNKRMEADAILRILDTAVGDILKPSEITKDVKKIYEMGYFDNVVVNQEFLDSGVNLTFNVTEKPTVRRVSFKKNTTFEDDELSENVNTATGAILNIHKLNRDVEHLRLLHMEKNFYNCLVTYEILPLENSQADIVFTINEGNKIRVEKISFEGNKYFTDKKIKKAIETTEKGFLYFFTSSGDLNETEVQNDVIRIESLYKNNGFIDTKVSDPDIEIGEESISILFKIEEGSQYSVNNITLKGDLIVPEEQIFEVLESKKSELYNREHLRKDVLAITDIYGDKGYANVNISPGVEKIEGENLMNLSFSISKGEPVYFNRINIKGNLKTRDKVIRREIKVKEQDLYSKKNIGLSFKNLNRLNYFSAIDVKPVKTSQDNLMDLDVTIVEKQTGNFSIGGGFSSTDGGFLSGSVKERNLFGRGHTAEFEIMYAENTLLFKVGFFEPYILDTRLSGGIQAYNEAYEYDYYDKDALGLILRLGYRLSDYAAIGIDYNIEDYEIDNVDSENTLMTRGSFLTSRITPYIRYDSRDDLFMPTEGMVHKFSVEYAGEILGGEIDYTKYLLESSFFYTPFWDVTLGVHTEAGYLDDRTNDSINIDFVKFYLGGMHSIRGFDKYDISGKRLGDTRDKGGEQFVQLNIELTTLLVKDYKLAGVLFYDRGDVYLDGESIDFNDQYSSVGAGLRWDSPVGPLRVEYGWVIDGKDVKKRWDGKFEFSVGASF